MADALSRSVHQLSSTGHICRCHTLTTATLGDRSAMLARPSWARDRGRGTWLLETDGPLYWVRTNGGWRIVTVEPASADLRIRTDSTLDFLTDTSKRWAIWKARTQPCGIQRAVRFLPIAAGVTIPLHGISLINTSMEWFKRSSSPELFVLLLTFAHNEGTTGSLQRTSSRASHRFANVLLTVSHRR